MRDAQAVAGAARHGIRVSLRWKLSLLITALVGLAVVLVGLFLLRQQQQSLTAEMTKRGLTIAKSLAASAKAPLITNDELTLLVMVKDAMRDPDVAYVIVADVDGKVLAQSDASPIEGPIIRPADLLAPKDDVLIQTYRTAGRRIIDFSDLDKTMATNAPGESAQPASPCDASACRLGVPPSVPVSSAVTLLVRSQRARVQGWSGGTGSSGSGSKPTSSAARTTAAQKAGVENGS